MKKNATVIKSVCQMCGTNYAACGIDVHVEDGKVLKTEGTKGHPVNDGRLCPKGLAITQMLYKRNRLLYPIKRTGDRGEGKWQRISWDEAMDTIVAKLKEIVATDGPRAIAWLKGQGSGWQGALEYSIRFMRLIHSPNWIQPGHNCESARGVGHVFTYGMRPNPDYENTNLIILWGYNPVNTSMPNAVRIMKAKQRGVKLMVIDPRFTKTAAKADIFVQVRPGSDGALALGMLNVIIGEDLYDKEFVEKWVYGFDELAELVAKYPPEKVEEITWVPAETTRQVARIYARTKPACLYEANGIEQLPNAAQTSRALSILQAITGNLDVPGGNVQDPESVISFLKSGAGASSVSSHPLFFQLGYFCSVPELRDAILTDKPYPIKAVIVDGMNLAVGSSDTTKVRQALTKVPFLVVFDHTVTPTAELADLVLPACTFLERDEVIRYRAGSTPRVDGVYYQLQRKAVEPLGESKSNYDFVSDLAKRMGYQEEWPWQTVEEWIDHQLKPVGITYQELADHPEDMVKRKHLPRELYRKYHKFFSLPLFPDKKCAFYSEAFRSAGYDPLPTYVEPGESPVSRPDLLQEYPLVCMASLKPGPFTHTQFQTLPWLREVMPEPWVEIHSEKAKELHLKDGDMVVVKSLKGSIELKCKVFDSLDPRVVAVTHGWWEPVTNLLTPSEYSCPITGSTSDRCFLVNVAKK
ncbi:molybdopterin-dependent oxidoreductase [Chloroflexota bacterium]